MNIFQRTAPDSSAVFLYAGFPIFLPPGGAKSIVDSGVLNDVENIFGILETKTVIEKELRVVGGIESEFGVKGELIYTSDYPPLYNDPGMTALVKESLESADDKDIKKVSEYPQLSPSDDFAYYLEKIPGCYFYIGCTPEGVNEPYFNHHPKFDIDEDALLVAAKAVGTVFCGNHGME